MLLGDAKAQSAADPPRNADSQWSAPLANQAQSISPRQLWSSENSEPAAVAEKTESESPSRVEPFPRDTGELKQTPEVELLPVPQLPSKEHGSVTPVSYDENPPSENVSPVESGIGSTAAEKTAASGSEKLPLSPQNQKSKLPLSPNGKKENSLFGKSDGSLPSMISVVGSTGLVLGIFLLLVWLVKRKTPQSLTRLPSEAFEVLGRAPLSGRQQVHLLRCGNRLLLVSVTPGGAETLTEITDPLEVDRLAGLCRQSQPGSSSAAFKQVFEQLASRRAPQDESTSHDDASQERSAGGYRRGGRGWENRHV
jgi:flagellar biogenesis protein FliO